MSIASSGGLRAVTPSSGEERHVDLAVRPDVDDHDARTARKRLVRIRDERAGPAVDWQLNLARPGLPTGSGRVPSGGPRSKCGNGALKVGVGGWLRPGTLPGRR
jgi:hypothetical protein